MKALNPTLERLEERIAPDPIGSIGIGIGINLGLGIGGGTSACNNSASRGNCSTQCTVSGSCNSGNSH